MKKTQDDVAAVKKVIGDKMWKQLAQYFASGHLCLADIAKISMRELENLHRLGCQHLVRKDYVRAVRVFESLVRVYPHSPDFWGSYGIALHRQEKYEKARIAYAVANELDSQKMEWYVYSAECELMLENPKFALELVKPVFHMKNAEGAKGVEMFKRAKRIKAIAENMESGPADLPATRARQKKDAAPRAG